ncbi:chromatin associated protein KTI12 [Scheffersomyces xylosifermentans]|uniref:chromatin associated protein KTI12 n=1 Tax=Scheffersomyces xylosifermentans TaxID=1304137 RepID=UPI00315DC332
MPLITFTGLPSSGKTTFAKSLQAQLQSKIDSAKESNQPGANYSIIYHSDETLGISHDVYTDSNLEKHARGSQMSAVKRDLSRSNIVILDSLAYIKGFRYQLFCEAKGVVTPHCVIQVMNPVEKCIEWNESESKENKWKGELIQQLSMRYEEPNSDSRWDSPLFTVVAEDKDEKLPIEEIWDALVLKRPPPPNAATLVKATSGNNFLQELDKQTSQVINKILQHQQLMSIGGEVLIDKDQGLLIEMPSISVSISQLQRIRRTYISLNRMRSVDIPRITPLFVEYVNRSLNSDD